MSDARSSKKRRLPSADDTAAHAQASDASDSELPSSTDGTTQVPFEAEAEANRGDGDGGSYTLKTPKGAMRFFGMYSLTDCRFSMVTRMVELILPRRVFSVLNCFP